ncbi:DUF192 domain-containing protein [Aliiroseovarius sp. 2305UL8-7]|uniref:DUF192 domain-containing protein n=1 Tax=Aliiroseovarius conchicola TaxID=3121637 RepID=UPI0035277A48
MGALFLSGQLASAADCDPAYADLKGDWGQARFSVEVVDTPRSRALGLMGRETMAQSHGMLFLFEAPQEVSFWMKDTLIPLDMLFLHSDGTVARVHENAVPHDLTLIPGGQDILAVLEVNGGIADRFGINEGTVLRHPMLDQDAAAWACDSAK